MKIFNLFKKQTPAESPLKIATAYESYAFEDMIKRTVKEAMRELYAPKTDDDKHPSGMSFTQWAISATHSIGAMRSEYDALAKREKQQQE